jgi:hypothetical protein
VAHVGTGFGIGLVFGGVTLALRSKSALQPLSTAELATQGVNEILFPIGCALVLFAAQALGNRAALRSNDDRPFLIDEHGISNSAAPTNSWMRPR